MNVKIITLLVIVAIGIAGFVYFNNTQTSHQKLVIWDQAVATDVRQIDHSAWQELLENYVETDHDSGIYLFDYSSVDDEDFAALENYITQLSKLDPRNYNRIEQKAYWINLYNALTVKLIVENYPVESITKLGKTIAAFGPWDDRVISIAEQALSLNDIEHGILRPLWQDPRIHFAVNCASIGCPNLQAEAFTADNMETLLAQAATEYVEHPRGVRIDNDQLVLSSIFDWYAEDFGANTTAVLQTLGQYTSGEIADQLYNYQGSIRYEYDWRLNDPESPVFE